MNTEMIDQLVSKEALTSLDTLNTKLASSYDEMEQLLSKVQVLSTELSKPAKSYIELSKVIERSNAIEQENKRLTDELNKTLQEKKKLIEDVMSSEKNYSKVVEEAAKAQKGSTEAIKTNISLIDISKKAYEEAAKSIDEQRKNHVSLQLELKGTQTELSRIEKLYESQRLTQEQYIEKKATLLEREQQQKVSIKQLGDTIKYNNQIISTSIGTYDNLSAQYSRLKIQINQMSDAEKINGYTKKELEAQAKALYEQMSNLQKQTGKHQLDVGKYDIAVKDLTTTLRMVDPTLGVIVGRIQQLSSVKSIWNDVNKKLTASLGITTRAATLMQMAVVGLVLGGVMLAVNAFKKWQEQKKQTAKELADICKSIQDQVTEIRILDASLRNQNNTYDQRLAALNKLKEIIPGYNAEITKEGNIINDNNIKIEAYIENLKKAAIAKAYANKVTEAANELAEWESEKLPENSRVRELYEMEEEAAKNLSFVDWAVRKEILRQRKEYTDKIDMWIKRAEKAQVASLKAEEEETYSLISSQQKLLEQAKKMPETTEAEITAKNKKIKTIDDEITRLKNLGIERGNSSKKAEDLIKTEQKAANDLAVFKIQQERDTAQEIFSNSEQSLSDRYQSAETYFNKQKEMIEKQRDFELSNTELTESQRALITLKADAEIEKAKKSFENTKNEIEKEGFQKAYDNAVQAAQDRQIITEQDLQNELLAHAKKFKEGKMKREDYEKEKITIIKRYAIIAFEQEFATLEATLKAFEGNAEIQEKIAKELAKKKAEYAKFVADAEIKGAEDSVKEQMSLYDQLNNFLKDNRTQTILTMWDMARDMANMYYDDQLKRIDELEEREMKYFDDKIDHIENNVEAGLMSEEEADARKRIIEANRLEKEKEIDQKRKDMQLKQAKWEKANAIIQATIATSLAVTKALPNLILAALVGIMGAAQISMIASQDVPAYKYGTESHPGGLAVVGDGGRSEMVVLPSGEIWKTPAKDTLVNLPMGTEILPDYRLAMMNMVYPEMPTHNDKTETIVFHDDVLRENTKGAVNEIKKLNKNVSYLRGNLAYKNTKSGMSNYKFIKK